MKDIEKIEKAIKEANEEVTAGKVPDKDVAMKQFIKMTHEIVNLIDEEGKEWQK